MNHVEFHARIKHHLLFANICVSFRESKFEKCVKCTNEMTDECMYVYLGPDYMSRAGPVSRDDVGLPGSRHFC